MKVTRCPYCANATIISDAEWGQQVQCEAPKCERLFSTAHLAAASAIPAFSSAPLLEVATPHPFPYLPNPNLPRYNHESHHPDPRTPLPGDQTFLTGPYCCHTCRGLIFRPQCQRRATFTHFDLLRSDPCQTSTYAAIYHCPKCQTLLESPQSQWGLPVTCPVSSCQETFTAPFDNVLHRHTGDAAAGTTFSFKCPSCQCQLRADSQRDGAATDGLPVVCLGCRHIIPVASAGVSVNALPAAFDASQALTDAPLRRCRGCQQQVPANATPCPVCGYPEHDIETRH